MCQPQTWWSFTCRLASRLENHRSRWREPRSVWSDRRTGTSTTRSWSSHTLSWMVGENVIIFHLNVTFNLVRNYSTQLMKSSFSIYRTCGHVYFFFLHTSWSGASFLLALLGLKVREVLLKPQRLFVFCVCACVCSEYASFSSKFVLVLPSAS